MSLFHRCGIVRFLSEPHETTSPVMQRTRGSALLTPTEIRVAELIRQGRKTKEIVEILRLSVAAVLFHRKGIRRKLGLHHSWANLQSHLQTLKDW
ncbi:MAG: response regulator transcription factor [Syntrophobacteraceae bacterium]